MAILGSLQVRMGLDTASFGDKFNSFTKGLQKKANGFQRSMAGLTSFGNLGASLGVSAGLANMIDTSARFQTSLNQVAAASDATGEQMAGLSAIALEMGRTTVFGANEAAGAMLELAKAGITPAEMAAGALKGTMQLAATEGMELSRAATVMSETMGAFALKAADSASIADALAGASIASTAGVEDLSQGLAQVSAVANLAGQNLNSTVGTLALFASNGIKGSDAGTSLKTMLLRLIPATKEAANEMKKYQLQFTNADGSIKSITEVADQLRTKLGSLSEAQRQSTLQTIFGTDAYRAAGILTKSAAGELEKYIAATQDANAAEKLSEARTQGAGGAMLRFKNSIESLGISITSGGLLDGLTSLVNVATDFVNKLATAPDWAKNLAVGFAVGLAVLPPFALALSSIVTAVPAILSGLGMAAGFLTGPFGLAIVAAIGTWVLFKDEIMGGIAAIKQWFTKWVVDNQSALFGLWIAWDELKGRFAPLVEALKQGIKNFADQIAKAFGGDSSSLMESFGKIVGDALTSVVKWLKSAIEWTAQIVQWLIEKLPAAGTTAGAAVVSFVTTLRTWFGQITTFLQPVFDAWKAFMNFLGEALKTVGALLELFGTAVQVAFQKVMEMVAPSTQSMETFKAVIVVIKQEVQTMAAIFGAAFQAVARHIKEMWDSASGYLSGLRGSIESVTNTLKKFTSTGEETTDKAVTHSWLADLCTEGAAFFQHLITGGINPAAQALKDFSAQGASVKAPGIGMGPDGVPSPMMDLASSPKQLEGAWSTALDHVGRAIDDFVKGGKLNFKDLISSFIADLASAQLKKAAEALFRGLSSMLQGALGGGGGGGSWASVAGDVFKAFASFEGGGYTGSAPRTGGIDGKGGRMAILHPRETVIDHTAVKSSGGRSRDGGVTVNTPITLMPGVSHEELSRILPQVQASIVKLIPELITRGGGYARAFGQ